MTASALGPKGHKEVRRFAAALSLESDFALHVVVADRRRVLREALAKATAAAEREAMVVGRPPYPEPEHHEDESTLVEHLLTELGDALAHAGNRLVVVDAVFPRWTEWAWHAVFRRLNEVRNFVESTTHTSLILCVTPSLETALGHEAPDLWSKRGSGMRLEDHAPPRVIVGRASSDDPGLADAIVSTLTDAGFEATVRTDGIQHGELDFDFVVGLDSRAYGEWLRGDTPGARALSTQILRCRVPATRMCFVVPDAAIASPPEPFEEGIPILQWPAGRETLLAMIERESARRRLVYALEIAFAEDHGEITEWEDQVLSVSTHDEADAEHRLLALADGLLGIRDPEAQQDALEFLAMRLRPPDRALLEDVATPLGLSLEVFEPIPFRLIGRADPALNPDLVPHGVLGRVLRALAARYGPPSRPDRAEDTVALFVRHDPIPPSRGYTEPSTSDMATRVSMVDAFVRARSLGQRAVAVFGGLGSGKSTQIAQFITRLTEFGAESVGLPLGTLPIPLDPSMLRDAALVAVVQDRIVELHGVPSISGDAAERLIRHGHVLLVVDGMDPQAMSWIERALRRSPHIFALVTIRDDEDLLASELGASFFGLVLRP